MTSLLIPLVPQPVALDDCDRMLEAELALSGPSLRPWSQAVSMSADAALVIDPRGAVVAVSDAGARLLGRAVADLLGRELARSAGFVDFHVAPQAIGRDGAALVPMQALRTDSPARGLLRLRRDDGTLVTCDTVASPLHDETGRLTGVLVLLDAVNR